MAVSPVCPVPPAPAPTGDVDDQESPTGRSLLPDFEQANEELIDLHSKVKSLKIETTVDVKSSLVSPNCVMNPPDATDTLNDDVSSSPPPSPEHMTPLVQAAQREQPADTTSPLPDFKLHPSLAKNLTQPQLNRISFYGGVIHDINKEASEMASNDSSSYKETNPNSVVIDEEQWLINTIANRTKEETGGIPNRCPSSFSDAIGETEVDNSNPLSNLNSSRTQLWKPSRSWWEARSGKNPWIEPRSHNKRWRYLWPLIHYHKFLARCIKKLKRNGVEVRNFHSPVCVFLREEVCAISDHLAEVSKFTAEEWLESLYFFKGWTDTSPKYESSLRDIVSRQKLRSLAEPTDVNSPLLRNQIDEQFLRAMENARLNMQAGGKYIGNEGKNRDMLCTISEWNSDVNGVRQSNYRCDQNLQGFPANFNSAMNIRFKNSFGKSKRRMNQPNHFKNVYNYPFGPGPYLQDMNQHLFQQMNYGTLNSGMFQKHPMSHDSMQGQFFPPPQMQQPGINGHPHQYSHQYTQLPVSGYQSHPSYPPMHDPSDFHNENVLWQEKYFAQANVVAGHSYNCFGSPAGSPHCFPLPNYSPVAMNPQKSEFHHPMGMPQPSPSHDANIQMQTSAQVPPSPYWGHLDPMSGLASPQHPSHPQMQSLDPLADNDIGIKTPNHSSEPHFVNPPLPYNYYQQHGRPYVPPSPATQFLMSQTSHPSGYLNNHINMASQPIPPGFPFGSPPHLDELDGTESTSKEQNSENEESSEKDAESEE